MTQNNGTIYSDWTDSVNGKYHNMVVGFLLVQERKGGKIGKMDEYKKYVKVETFCKQCGRHINREANFIEYRCECKNWIPLTAFSEVAKNVNDNEIAEKQEEKLIAYLRRDGWSKDQIQRIVKMDNERAKGKIYGVERGKNKCLESDFEKCFWDGYEMGYVGGCNSVLTSY